MDKEGRELSKQERVLVAALLVKVGAPASLVSALDHARVVDMQDGGMGSIRFLRGSETRRYAAIAEAQYVDADGVLVSVELNAAKDGELCELDFWKVDFSPLRRYPQPEDLRELRAPSST